MNLNIYEFTDPKEFLVNLLKEKQISNPRFSLRSWSKQLGFSSPNMLSMILRGERSLRPRLATLLAESLHLKEHEKKYLEVLTVFSRAKSSSEKNIYAHILKEMRPDKQFSTLAMDEFKYISDWYPVTIIEMMRLKDFKPDPSWISKRLGSCVSTQMVKDALERLIRIQILKRDKNGKLMLQKKDSISTTYDIPDEAIQKFHTQMIEKALDAIKQQPIDKREISSITFTIDSAKIKKAKELIRHFQDDLSKVVSTDKGDQTYQLNVQFFNLTEGEAK